MIGWRGFFFASTLAVHEKIDVVVDHVDVLTIMYSISAKSDASSQRQNPRIDVDVAELGLVGQLLVDIIVNGLPEPDCVTIVYDWTTAPLPARK